MKISTVSAALVAAVVSLALAACTPTAAPTETVTVKVTETAESPDPGETTATADCPEWVDDLDGLTAAPIDFNRFAGICLGMSFEEASAVAGIPIQGDEFCPWFASIVADDEVGLYVYAVSDSAEPGASISYFGLDWYEDPTAAWAYEMPYTEQGVRPGTPQADVAAWYPESYNVTLPDDGFGAREQQVIPGPDGLAIVGDIVDGYVASMYWGEGLTNGGPTQYLCGE